MTNTVEFKVYGLKELHDSLMKLPRELVAKNGGPVKTALMAGTLLIQRTAETTVPDLDTVENTGRLARSIRRRRGKTDDTHREIVQVYVRKGKNRDDPSGAWYAPMVEFGHPGYPATGWFRRAAEANREKSIVAFRTSLAGAIARIAKKIGNENMRAVARQIKGRVDI